MLKREQEQKILTRKRSTKIPFLLKIASNEDGKFLSIKERLPMSNEIFKADRNKQPTIAARSPNLNTTAVTSTKTPYDSGSTDPPSAIAEAQKEKQFSGC